ncbi:MAG TPA: DinB family protein [Thermoanaerobaculia bacterium]|jgi:uncharacterized damage-inducible protein DinB|nr:DinB family protein [Thermoanaerobaculia bacterium]
MQVRHLLATLLLVPSFAFAQQTHAKAPATAVQNGKGFRTEFFADLDEVQDKITRLATAVPSEKYAWRPAEGVRSISEVYTHIAGANYFLATFVNVQPPSTMPKDIEKITDKKLVLAELQKSFDHLRMVMRNTPDADLDKQVMLFGKPTTERAVFSTILNHLHEHLGQSIAYARMNGVVPPWSGN